MAKAPAGPIGNSPRDMRDDAVGVPAENVKAPAPPRWPPKRKKITSNTFHAKVGGGTSAKRADRPPHYRRGGMVSPRAAGGPVESKNDPGDLGNKGLKKGGVVKRDEGGKVPKMPKPRPLPKEPINPVGPERDLGEPPPRSFPVGPERDLGEPPPRSFPLGEKYKDGGKLSAAQRQSLPKSDFALPGAGKGPKGAGSGSYPIPDRSHAANALARSSGKPVHAEVERKVHAKYPDMGEDE